MAIMIKPRYVISTGCALCKRENGREIVAELLGWGSACMRDSGLHGCGSANGSSLVSRTTSAGFLSSRMATKMQYRKCPAAVHSTNATRQTSFGLTSGIVSYALQLVARPTARPFSRACL